MVRLCLSDEDIRAFGGNSNTLEKPWRHSFCCCISEIHIRWNFVFQITLSEALHVDLLILGYQ